MNIAYFKVAFMDELAHTLRQFGYGSFDKHLWISPYAFSEDVIALVMEKGLYNSIYLFQSELIGNRLPEEIVSEIWPVEELNKLYEQYISG